MTVSARTLRRVLLVTALLLIAVILGFLGYARYRARRYLAALPHKLGVDIKQETNGFTYSQSVGGRTIFTVHASKEIQRMNGRITLHDVAVTLYGRTPGSTDRIHGNDFEYDPGTGTLSAQGQVFLDLQAPAANSAPDSASARTGQIIHLATSGLVFCEKQRTAETEQPIEFSAGGLSGHADGALYDSNAGTLVLKRSVAMHEVHSGRPLTLTASHAEIDRPANLVQLTGTSISEAVADGDDTLHAQNARVTITPDGTPTAIDAKGAVLLTEANGATASGDHLRISLNNSQANGTSLREARLSGNVRFKQAAPGQMRDGQAQDVEVSFDSAGKPAKVIVTGSVVASEDTGSVSRTLHAVRVQLLLATDHQGRTEIQQAEGFGDSAGRAQLTMRGPQPKTNAQASTQVSGEHLIGQFATFGESNYLQVVQATGQTEIDQTVVSKSGERISEEHSHGDTLRASFAPGHQGGAILERAEQQGHVDAARQVAATIVKGRAVPAQTQHAHAEKVQLEAAGNRILLTGAVAITDPAGQLLADQVRIDRTSNIAEADGSVRVTYTPPGERSEPLHITAARAESNQTTGVTRFFNSRSPGEQTGSAVRLWQQGSQVQAAEIDFDRVARDVIALGQKGTVRAVLVSPDADHKSGLTRITAQQLAYSDTTHVIQLKGDVKVASQQGTLASNTATVQLASSSTGVAAALPGAQTLMGGKVEQIEADGGVALDQAGRRAMGDKLVYTAADQTYVLTGTKSAPPRLSDEVHGTITGARLQFHAADDSVEILSGAGRRVSGEAQLSARPKGKKR